MSLDVLFLIFLSVAFHGKHGVAAENTTPEERFLGGLGGCNIETGVYISAGNDVNIISSSGQEECSSACASTDGCVAWTMQTSGSSCWLKSDDSSKGNGEGWITGTKECGIKADSFIREGDYENHAYDNGGKNGWHYVTIKRVSGDTYIWTNRAGVSWNLYVMEKSNTLRVGEDCPYYKDGYTEAVFNSEGVFGPGNEFYKFEDSFIREGEYENHAYDNGGKNDWHYVTIKRASGDTYKWTNKAGVSWNLYVMDKKNSLRVGEDCPYYKDGHTEAVFNSEGVFGPGNEFYKFENGLFF